MIEKGISRILTFTMRDSTTGQPKTTLNVGDVTVKISKDGGAFAATTNAPVAIQDTGVNTGEFSLTLTATEMTADSIVLKATATACIEVRQKIATEANYTATKAGYLTGTVALDSTVTNAFAAHEANRVTMENTLVAEHDATQALIAAIPNTLGGDKVVTMTVRDNLTDATIPDVVYYVFDTEGVIRYSGMTDGNGFAEITANSGNYTVKLHKALVNFAASYSLVVSGNVNVTLKGDLLTIPVPTVPGMCVIIADLAAVGMAPKAGVKLTAIVKQPPKTVNGIFLDQEPWEAVTQPNGRATLEVPQGVIWNVSFAPIGMDIEVDTTGAASINLKDNI